MNPALRTLFHNGPPNTREIDTFIDNNEFPLVDGTEVTFVYRGTADAVYLHCWVSGFDSPEPFRSLNGTDLWISTIELPEGSRIEYQFEIETDGKRDLILDPLNEIVAHDPFGANSVCQGAGYERPPWTLHHPEARSGTIDSLEVFSSVFGETRATSVYVPASFRSGHRYPLLVVHDGNDYVKYADIKTVLDNLIHSAEIAPLIVAFIQSPARLEEYGGNDRHANFIANDLLPQLALRYPLESDSESTGIMGASFGAVAALHSAWRYPGLFRRLLLQSGSFAYSDSGRRHNATHFDAVIEFLRAFREDPGQLEGKIYMSCGIYESLIHENRALVPHLQRHGLDVRLEEVRDAHNWENWRDRLQNGLSWLFPGCRQLDGKYRQEAPGDAA
jgi:enterochelin esterase-like enzyme